VTILISCLRRTLSEHAFSQDTNLLQFDLLRYMAPHGAVSIVGDPDQSSMNRIKAVTCVLIYPSIRMEISRSRELEGYDHW
jgi:hypothetical protein